MVVTFVPVSLILAFYTTVALVHVRSVTSAFFRMTTISQDNSLNDHNGTSNNNISATHMDTRIIPHTEAKTGDDGWNTVPSGGDRRRNRPRRPVQASPSVTTGLSWSAVPLDLSLQALTLNDTTSVRPYMLLLAGLPGSGKSTFSRSLLEAKPKKVRQFCGKARR